MFVPSGAVNGGWQSSNYFDPELTRLVRAIVRRRYDFIYGYPHTPVQEQPLRHDDDGVSSPFVAAALIHLWDHWEDSNGACPSCMANALMIGVEGNEELAWVHGVCTACEQVVHRYYSGSVELSRHLVRALEGTRFRPQWSWTLNSSGACPHTSLIAVLRSLGESDLPDPLAYGFPGGGPEPAPCLADPIQYNTVRRAIVWASRAAIIEKQTGYRIELDEDIEAHLDTFVTEFLVTHSRLPEGPVGATDRFWFEFPIIRTSAAETSHDDATLGTDDVEAADVEECEDASPAHAALDPMPPLVQRAIDDLIAAMDTKGDAGPSMQTITRWLATQRLDQLFGGDRQIIALPVDLAIGTARAEPEHFLRTLYRLDDSSPVREWVRYKYMTEYVIPSLWNNSLSTVSHVPLSLRGAGGRRAIIAAAIYHRPETPLVVKWTGPFASRTALLETLSKSGFVTGEASLRHPAIAARLAAAVLCSA